MSTPIVTLTTDWGRGDFFVGMVKGKLMSSIPGVNVVDITHDIEPYNINSAVFVAKNACPHFPKGTIHIIDVDSVETIDNAFVVIENEGSYYICVDNGMPYALFGSTFTKGIRLNVNQDGDFYTFAAYSLFCKVAAMIASGEPLEKLGYPLEELVRKTSFNYIINENSVIAYVSYIDSYGNAYLNISYDQFEDIRKGRKFSVSIHNHRDETLTRISYSYIDDDVKKNRFGLLLTVSVTGQLQIAVSHNSAEQLLSLRLLDKLEFRFSS